MECRNCKKTIADGSMFCNFCGVKQTSTPKLNIDEMAEKVEDKLRSVTGCGFSEAGFLRCKSWIRDFGLDIVYDSVEIALDQYLVVGSDGNYTAKSIHEAFSKIGGIANNKHTELTKPYIPDARRITNYAQKAFFINRYELEDLTAALNNLLYYFFITQQYDGKVEDILALVRGSRNKHEFLDKIESLNEIYFQRR